MGLNLNTRVASGLGFMGLGGMPGGAGGIGMCERFFEGQLLRHEAENFISEEICRRLES